MRIGAPIDTRGLACQYCGMTKEQAVAHFKTQQALAAALGLTQGTVSGWGVVPFVHQVRLERMTGGALVADDAETFVSKQRTAA